MILPLGFGSQQELYAALISPDHRLESRAFDYVYKELYGSFRQWVFTHNGSDQDAEDSFQRGLLNFVMNIRAGKYQFQETAKVTTVIFEYCKKIWLNEVDSSRLKTRSAMPENFESLEVTGSQHDEMERSELVSTVKMALNQLKGDCQKVIEWFYIEELSIKEIAEKLDMKETSTKQKRFDCTEKLKVIYLNLSQKLDL